ncbi:hypothetical protein PybrP1_003844 [[Pythium] brassicae (nom. inval.)]|nr:hypothetical protein PybrP1_003844 [[Pythium] brassicae (nom. inval.)]
MESARAFDAVLPPDSERRLARVFCFLRQHERKAKAARKRAELQKLSRARVAPSSPTSSATSGSSQQKQHPQTDHLREDGERDSGDDDENSADGCADTLAEQHRLLDELDKLSPVRLDTPLRAHKCTAETADFRNVPRSLEGTSDTNNHDASTTRIQQAENERRALILELDREIRELQKGIIPTTSVGLAAASEAAPTGALELSGFISAGDVVSAMKAMGRSVSKADVQWMIWEIDDDLDGCVDWHEFRSCCARTTTDRHGLEPNQLYHLIQFLLCDADASFTVSVLEVKAELKKLPGTDHLAAKLLVALKDDTEQQLLQKFTLSEYLDIMFGDLPSSSPLHQQLRPPAAPSVSQAAHTTDMSGPIARVIAQVVVMTAGVVSRAFVTAYQQAVHNAKSGNTAAAMAAKPAARAKNVMSREQALEILNFPTAAHPKPDEVAKQFTRYFEANDPAKGGSFYLQSKIFRAKEALEREQAAAGGDASQEQQPPAQ